MHTGFYSSYPEKYIEEMSIENKPRNVGRANSCSKLETRRVDPEEIFTAVKTVPSLPMPLIEEWEFNIPESLSTEHRTEERKSQTDESRKLVKNCGPDCMIAQRIVDKLLARMLKLENERAELVAANRSWAVQYKMMKERQENEIKALKDDLRVVKQENASMRQRQGSDRTKIEENKVMLENRQDTTEQISLLTQQVEIYREDFLEERKARARAHAQLESLRNELKRERKSRAKLTAFVQQKKSFDEPSLVVS